MDRQYLLAERQYISDPSSLENALIFMKEQARTRQLDLANLIVNPFAVNEARAIIEGKGLNFLFGSKTIKKVSEKVEGHIEQEEYELVKVSLENYEGDYFLELAYSVLTPVRHEENGFETYYDGRVENVYFSINSGLDIEEGDSEDGIVLFERESDLYPSERPYITSGCEDRPCCGHDICPPMWSHTGEQVAMVCTCGAYVPLGNRTSICDRCMRSGPREFDDSGRDIYGDYEDGDVYDWEEDPEYEEDWG